MYKFKIYYNFLIPFQMLDSTPPFSVEVFSGFGAGVFSVASAVVSFSTERAGVSAAFLLPVSPGPPR